MQEAPSNARGHITLLMASLDGRGVQQAFLNLAEVFRARGCTVDLLICRAQGALNGHLAEGLTTTALARSENSGVALWLAARRILPRHPRAFWALRHDRYRRRLPALVAALRERRPTALLSGGTQANLLAIQGALCVPAAQRPRVVVSEQMDLRAHSDRARHAWKARAVGRLYGYADARLCASQGVADSLVQAAGLAPRSVQVLHNPVVTPALLAQAAGPPPAHRWFADGGPPVVIGVGQLIERKNWALLLHAMAHVNAQRPARLMLLGEGPQREALETLARSLGVKLALPGFMHGVGAYLGHAAAFALTSRYEGFANVVAEALACGCPTVSVDCPSGPAEILGHGAYGRLVPMDDAPALARALLDTLAEAPDRTRLRARGADFNAAVIGARYLDVLLGTSRDPDSKTAGESS